MNLWQVVRQIRYQLSNRNWSGSATAIFPSGNVVVSQLPVESVAAAVGRVPFAMVRVLSGQVDPDHQQEPDILRRQVAVTVVAKVAGDRKGQDPILGAHRTSLTTSPGRGLLEFEEEVLDEIALMGAIDGVSIQYLLSTIPQPEILGDDPAVVACDYLFEATVTRQRFYHPVTGFTASDATGGNASLSWTLPPDRFDRYQIVLRRASGSTAPASETDGTSVTLASDLATSITDDPGAGTWSYSLFGAYDEWNEVGAASRSANRYSEAVSQTVVVT